ncbi:MAG TPA: ATP-dependent zinc metalloprotease FtsH [Gaiellaceae bacterium]|nr:ATP-dependent zinc metalloprotease FtsH [Gaiellaceae bacterium]
MDKESDIKPFEQDEGGDGKKGGTGIGWKTLGFFVSLLILNYLLASLLYAQSARPRSVIPYAPTFLTQVRDGNVVSVTSKGTAIQGTFRQALRYPRNDSSVKPTKLFSTEMPSFANADALDTLLQQNNVTVTAQPLETSTPWWETFLVAFGPALLFIALWVYAMRRYGGGDGMGLFSMGRAKPKQYEPSQQQRVTFADVAGIDEAKEELAEVVDFLREPEKYRKLGARIPRGVLLSGQPGTGKTLLARAVAGEANVPFFSMSASEFVEMVVGVGASRVRDLFAQAKAAAPSIIFIDEIDAIGRSRSSGAYSGANDEREQTLNQILTEMDGFDENTGVIVLAATNRADVLDPALLRPGRFDRRVTVQAPDKDGRKQILIVHTRDIPLAADVDLDGLAATTVGMVGADLANLANEAALLAAKRGHEKVTMSDFSDALEKIELGAARKLLLTPAEKHRTAYHEAGHALVGMLTPGADPVRKITIIPRTMSLGVTVSAPESDTYNYDKQALLAHIKVATGGRAAEEVVFGDETTGAESDIRQATQLARNMVGRYGMSDEIGFLSVVPQDGEGSGYGGYSEVSERTRQRIDDEMRRVVGEQHDEAVHLLEDNRDRLESLAEALFQAETLEGPEAYAAAGLTPPDELQKTEPAAVASR